MKRVVGALLVLASLLPVGTATADHQVISEPFVVLQVASRLGNATSTEDIPTQAPEPTPDPKQTPSVPAEVQQVLDLVNVERVARNLVPVTLDPELNAAALLHTQRQAADGAIYHQDPRDGSSPGDRIARAGYEFSTWGENVAAGYPTAESVMAGWMSSTGHCTNLLNPAFTEMGVGFVAGGERYNQFWSQVFARPSGVDRPSQTFNPAWC